MPPIEERLATLEAQMRSIETALIKLTDLTERHVLKATCVRAGVGALQYGSMGGGVVATVVFIGKLLGYW